MAYKDKRTNKWVASIGYEKLDGSKARKRKYGFKTKREAEQWEYENSGYIDINISKNISISDIASDFLKAKKKTVQITSYSKIEVVVRLHILPYLKDYKINKLDQKIILKWQDELSNKLTNQRINVCTTILKELFEFGSNLYNYSHDPFKNLKKLIVNDHKEISYYTLEEFNLFISGIDDIIYHAFFHTLYFCGFRKGEALALNWNDIDFEKKEISITKSVYQKLKDTPYLIKPPKNKSSYRKVKIDNKTILVLKNLKEHYRNNYRSFNNDRFVFGFNRPLHETTLNKKFHNYILKAGTKKIRIHDFRHSHASLLINNGANANLVAKRLGHSNVEMTLNTYSHLFPETEDKVIALINKLI